MKIDPKAVASIDRKKLNEVAVLPLVPEVVKYPKDKLLQFKLRTVPTDNNSPTYELTVPCISGREGVREAIKWKSNIEQVFDGMNAATAATRDALVRRALCDQAFTAYKNGVVKNIAKRFNQLRTEAYEQSKAAGGTDAEAQAAYDAVAMPAIHLDDVTEGMRELMNYIVPFKGLQRQKRFMRRKCRKPADMTAREFFNHFVRMNTQELPQMPPDYDHRQRLAEDEVIDILLFAFPASWSAEMTKQGFDPFAATSMEVLEFCERLEASEAVFQQPNKHGKAGNNDKGSSKKKSSGGQKSEGQYYCLHHGKNTTHDTNDCTTLKNQSKKLKSANDNSGGSKNKSWTKKAEHGKDKSKKELAALTRKMVREELNAADKKRKSDKKDDESVGSVNQIDEVDLAMFNYTDMDNLKIDTDDSEFDDEELKTEAEA
jgi:hypothetical protein